MAEESYLVKKSAELGRFLVAAKDLKAGEIVFQEEPFAVGPKTDSTVVCLGCNCSLDAGESCSKCASCGWPLCTSCNETKARLHFENECPVFTENNVKFQNISDPQEICHQLDCITPLRILLASDRYPERWAKEVLLMESHDAARKALDTWKIDDTNIVQYIRGPCKLSKYSPELIQQVIGILEVNAFEARTKNGNPLRCLYPKLGTSSHSCVPNLSHTVTLDDQFKMVCRTTVDVAKGGVLNTTYCYTLWGTQKRLQHLRRSKFFECHCDRCKSPDEAGTHFSSLKCSKCDLGLILTTDPYDEKAEWRCTHCDFKTPGEKVAKMIATIEEEISHVEYMEYDATRLQQTERLFKRYRSVFHPNHFIQTGLRQQLIQMIGQVEGYEMIELPDVLLEHKIELIRNVMQVLDVIEPGMSRARAMMLFELHVPLIFQAKSSYAAGLLEGNALRERFKEVIKVLEECKAILEWEDPESPEGYCAKVAAGAIVQLQESLQGLED